MNKVLVNGITGHLGYAIAKELKDRGYHVRGAMRNKSRLDQYPLLKTLNLEIVEADVLDELSMVQALSDQDGFFQVAAVFSLTSKDPQKTVIEPNVRGTETVLRAAAKAKVAKIIYTSSIAAVGFSKIGEPHRDENHWNLEATDPYTRSKALSEKRAWELAKDLGLKMVSVLPGMMLGPGNKAPTATVKFLIDVLKGKIPGALPTSLSYVDVRDVAKAHVDLYENSNASGRYIATHETLSMSQFIGEIIAHRPHARASSRTIPPVITRIFPYLDALKHMVTGSPRTLTRALVQDLICREQRYNSTRLSREIGWTPRPVKESIRETIAWIEQQSGLRI